MLACQPSSLAKKCVSSMMIFSSSLSVFGDKLQHCDGASNIIVEAIIPPGMAHESFCRGQQMEKSTTKLLPPFFNGEKTGQGVVVEVLRALDIRRGTANVVDERIGERCPCPSKKWTVVSKTFIRANADANTQRIGCGGVKTSRG